MRKLLPLAIILAAQPLHAETVFDANFQDGKTTGWGALGNGTVSLSSFEGNVSLRVTGGANAEAELALKNWRSLYVRSKTAASGLAEGEACTVATSTDGGQSWRLIRQVGKDQADGVTLWQGISALPSNIERLTLRLAAPQGTRAQCWFDDIVVSGLRNARQSSFKAQQLIDGSGLDNPADLSAFWPAQTVAIAPKGKVEGRLTIAGGQIKGWKQHHRDDSFRVDSAIRELPPLSIDLVQSGERVIPVQRGLIEASHSAWDWILEPGKAWSETGDPTNTRIALPFALQEKNANCTHNGMLTFLIDASGKPSKVAWQIATETCRYNKFDAWGFAEAKLEGIPVPNRDALIKADSAQVAARLPVKSVDALGPERALQLATAAGPEPTAYGLLLNGIYYRGGCATRHGDYPACDAIGLPSYSVAKSIFGGVGLMRLEAQKPGAAATRISPLVEGCPAKAWSDVSIEQVLDMATGNYRSAAYTADEDHPDIFRFLLAKNHSERLNFACNFYPRKAKPGSKWVYHTSDTYLASVAMGKIVKADPYDGLVRPLWQHLKLSPTLDTTRRSEGAIRQPFTGWGLTYQADDVVRIAQWLDRGADGMLNKRLLNAALQRDPASTGLPAGFPGYSYRMGFWSRDVGQKKGCRNPVHVPFMSGFGGISVAILPGGAIFQTHGDSDHWDWSAAVALVEKSEVCQ